MDRLFDRAFSKIQSDINRVQEAQLQEEQTRSQEQEPEESAPVAIKRILKAWQDKEYFKLLNLPDPVADELGKPTWTCTAADVSRAYRQLSVSVHPDKNAGEEARAAFEVLNETHRMLKDASKLEQILRDVTARARLERDRRDAAAAALSGHAHVAAAKNAATKKLRHEQGAVFEDEIRKQMQRRVEAAKRKADAVARARATALQQETVMGEGSTTHSLHTASRATDAQYDFDRSPKDSATRSIAGVDGQEDDDVRREALTAARKRKKPTILH